jgi:hypothetical protein
MKIDPKLAQVGRVAFRVEGPNWNAYFALPDSMEGAVYLGSMRMALVEREDRKNAFIAFMREVVGDILEDSIGVRPTWPTPPQRAPEHERTKE